MPFGYLADVARKISKSKVDRAGRARGTANATGKQTPKRRPPKVAPRRKQAGGGKAVLVSDNIMRQIRQTRSR